MTPNSSIRLAIFDFDDTLFDGQSLSDFISFLESKLPLYKMLYAKIRKRFEGKETFADNKRHKEYLLGGLTSFSRKQYSELGHEFYKQFIKPRLMQPVLDELAQKRLEGYSIVIASGGFDVYLESFKAEYQVEYMITSKLSFDGNTFTGRIEGDECLGEAKALAIRQLMDNKNIDWAGSVFYSDHLSDMPTFKMVGEKVVVLKENKVPQWVGADYRKIIVG